MGATGGLAQRMVLGGEGLSARTLIWGRREGQPPILEVTDRDLRLMALLLDVNFLSASQLVMLGWGRSGERTGQARLKRLHDGGYLDRFRPATGSGGVEWNYRLSPLGWSALVARGKAASKRPYTPTALTSIGYAEHDLQLAALILHIAQVAANAPAHALLEAMPFTWRGPRSGRIETETTEQVVPSPAADVPPGTWLHAEDSRRGYLEPDATLVRESDDERWGVLIEYDRTDRPHKQIDRLRRYDYWLLKGWRQGPFAAHTTAPSVLFLTSRERPLGRLIQTADRTFSAWYGKEHAGPREGIHPARKRVLFTSRERVLGGDWTMNQTPELPPTLRENPGVCWPVALTCDLPSLFAY